MLAKTRARASVGLLSCLALSTALLAGPATHAVGASRTRTTATEIDPDTYQCTSPGFVGFENFRDGTALGSGTGSVPGLDFTGWSAGDFGTGNYDGKFPAGQFSSEETHWATNTASTSTIGLTSPASKFSVLIASDSTVTMQTFDAGHNLTATVSHVKRIDGRHMIQMEIDRPTFDIASVKLSTGSGFFTLDSVCTDDPDAPLTQLRLTVADGPPGGHSYLYGYGYTPGEIVKVTVDGVAAGTGNTVFPDGHFELSFNLPGNAQPGSNKIVATGQTSGHIGTANFLVHTDWVQFGDDSERTGSNLTEPTLTKTSVKGLKVLWKAPTDGGQATASVVAGGVVYVNTSNVSAYAFREASPAPDQIGHVATGEAIRAASAVDGTRVFIASTDGHVYAFSQGIPSTTPLWAFPPQGQASTHIFNTAPSVLNLVLYVADSKGTVYALNEATGKVNWQLTLPGASKTHSTLAVDNATGQLFIGGDNGSAASLYAVNVSTHTLAWSQPIGRTVHSDPVVDDADGSVYIGSDNGSVYAFDTTSGDPFWAAPKQLHNGDFPIGGTLALGGNLLFVGTGDTLGDLVALSPLTGNQQWAAPTGGAITTKPAWASNVVYVTSTNGKLQAYSMGGIRLYKSAGLGTTFTPSGPVVVNGAVWVGTGDGFLYKFGL
jgi:outer membrane protein assembly factor BamB